MPHRPLQKDELQRYVGWILAKKINLYSEITKKVIQKSFEFFEDKNVEFSINFSISDILEKDVVDFLIQKIYEFDIGYFLTIEITESELDEILKGCESENIVHEAKESDLIFRL